MKNKKCIICGKEFTPKSYNQIVCMDKHKLKCPICNKEYIASRNQIKTYYKTNIIPACSKQCMIIKIKNTKLEKYGDANYNNIEKNKQTKLEKYGDANYNNIEKVIKTDKEKYNGMGLGSIEINKKIKQTNIERYGDKNFNNREKFKQTCLEKFNTNTPLQNKEILNKTQMTNIKKYGGKSPMCSNEVRFKRKQNEKEKYGVIDQNQVHFSDYTKQILFNKNEFYKFCEEHKNEMVLTYCANILGIQDTTFRTYYDKYNCEKIYPLKSLPVKELEIAQFLDSLNIKYEKHNRKIIYPKELDYYIPNKKVAIEFNGIFYHNSTFNPFNSQGEKPKDYHYNKSKLCEEKGIRLIHIFEYEWDNERQRPILENIIKNALGINEYKIYARSLDIEIRDSKSMKQFFEENNIQGFRGGKFAICLVDKITKECYMSYMFGKAFFGKGKYEWEVIRGATKLGYTIIGGASKIWNYFIKNYNPKSCVYYIDYNYFNGNSLKNLPKMKFIKTQPSFKNYFIKEKMIKNRDPKHHQEITELYNKKEVLQIYNAGTKVYVWERDK